MHVCEAKSVAPLGQHVTYLCLHSKPNSFFVWNVHQVVFVVEDVTKPFCLVWSDKQKKKIHQPSFMFYFTLKIPNKHSDILNKSGIGLGPRFTVLRQFQSI